jgi:hypothetical protein
MRIMRLLLLLGCSVFKASSVVGADGFAASVIVVRDEGFDPASSMSSIRNEDDEANDDDDDDDEDDEDDDDRDGSDLTDESVPDESVATSTDMLF